MRSKSAAAAALLIAVMLTGAACSAGGEANNPSGTSSPSIQPSSSPDAGQNTNNGATEGPDASVSPSPSATPSSKPSTDPTPGQQGGGKQEGSSGGGDKGSAVEVTANAEAVTALVNKQFKLPKGYAPDDLVYPDIPFTFSEKIDKRKLRKEAAKALEDLVAAAKKDGIKLAGVSGYRTESRQKTLFDNYAKKDGVEAANKYSARPGHSEHQTGLAIDVSGIDGKCAAESCFGGTPEAEWLAKYAADYGYIIRYPEGKEAITGYKYEPWHIRYVGVDLAHKLEQSGDTLEEYYGAAVPVSGGN
ncbi:M15 family metallopeptidase [Paenibacillus pasadenensis]|uniref:M15 family metallopeptidase n=1 Tax=Paenibacillus pasadenensis TaxID=217090 RepID=UPI0020422E70|nr:M15 family metallopeptidase [Paenibacillus pasadenensis]MCM3748503.1 M15 family metallopeptidase [Paenibacillus pasadenensis]